MSTAENNNDSDAYERGMTLLDAGQPESALGCIQEHLLRCPRDSEALNDAGTLLYVLGRFDEAIIHLNRARTGADASAPQVLWNLAEAYLAADRPRNAAALFIELASHDMLSADLVNRTAAALLEQGNIPDAVEALLTPAPQTRLLEPIMARLLAHRPAVTFFSDGETSLEDGVIDFVSRRFRVRRCRCDDRRQLRAAMQSCDVAWFDCCVELLARASEMPKCCRIVCRLPTRLADAPALDRVRWENVDVLAADSPLLKRRLVMRPVYLGEDLQTVTIPHGRDVSGVTLSPRTRGKRCVSIGTIQPASSPLGLLNAFASLHRRDSEFELHFAGVFADDATESAAFSSVDELGLSKCVHFDGYQDDLPAYLDDKHYVVTAAEGSECADGVVEAAAAGLRPVFAAGAVTHLPPQFTWANADDFCMNILSRAYDCGEHRAFAERHFAVTPRVQAVHRVLLDLERRRWPKSPAEHLSQGGCDGEPPV